MWLSPLGSLVVGRYGMLVLSTALYLVPCSVLSVCVCVCAHMHAHAQVGVCSNYEAQTLLSSGVSSCRHEASDEITRPCRRSARLYGVGQWLPNLPLYQNPLGRFLVR